MLKNQKGITLLEVMVAMLIMSFSLLLLLNMAMVALDGNEWSNKTTFAAQLLQQKLEEIRASGNFTNGADTAQGVERTWTVQNAGNHLRRVDVRVAWRDMHARDQANTMTAYVRTDSL
ncbi:MAG: prepilin-type N-terminal cleavage/methylation domain-containing protein [candidate division Zixibacteria bacterium]|nr:prepilin-type N-terminal cleavage/methylation domain-containing protein [candidate division Zixibacteria bacterium]